MSQSLSVSIGARALACAFVLVSCSAKEPAAEGAIFGGQGALIKEVALPAAAGGGVANVAGAPVSSAGPCAVVAPNDVALIDDFEDGDLRAFKGYQRTGFWYTAADHSTAQKLFPQGQFTPVLLPRSEAGKSNAYAAHFIASGQTEWGALLGTTLYWDNAGVHCPLNLSAFQGVRFRGKGPGSFEFRVPMPETMPPEYGGVCSKGCYDPPAMRVTLSDRWDEYLVTWDRLQQGGWGTEVRFDPGRVLGLDFFVSVKALPADFWIDDLTLIPKTAPAAQAMLSQASTVRTPEAGRE